MELSQEDENLAMKVYLGGKEAKAYDPVGREERLRKEFGPRWRDVEKAMKEYLDPLLRRPEGWGRGSVFEEAAKLDAIIAECFPWFDPETRGLMTGCFIYEWK